MRLALLAFLALPTWLTAAPVEKLSSFQLPDQNAELRSYRFPKTKLTVLTVTDRKGSEQLAPWIRQLIDRYGDRIDIDGIADVSGVPKPFHAMVRRAFQKQVKDSVMLDWEGSVVTRFGYVKGVANIYVVDREGRVLKAVSGPAESAALGSIARTLDPLL